MVTTRRRSLIRRRCDENEGHPYGDKVAETAEKKVSGRRSLPAMKAPAKEKKLRLEEQATVIRRKRVKNVDTEGPIDAAKRTSESVQSDEKGCRAEFRLTRKVSLSASSLFAQNETDGSSVPLKKKKRAKSEKALSGSNDKGSPVTAAHRRTRHITHEGGKCNTGSDQHSSSSATASKRHNKKAEKEAALAKSEGEVSEVDGDSDDSDFSPRRHSKQSQRRVKEKGGSCIRSGKGRPKMQ
ncbi:hypothetical protein COOONC_02308, partial [Cooperia oncophora]